MIKSPCFQCIDRYQGCHIKCEKYAGWKQIMEERSKERQREQRADDYYKRTAAKLQARAAKRFGGKYEK